MKYNQSAWWRTMVNPHYKDVVFREQSLFMAGEGWCKWGGHKFQCKQIEGGGANFSANKFRGRQNFGAQLSRGGAKM